MHDTLLLLVIYYIHTSVAWQSPASFPRQAASPAHIHPQHMPQDLLQEAFSTSPALAYPSGHSSGGHQQQEQSTLPWQQAFTHGTPAGTG